MRHLISVLALVLLATAASAGSIRPAAVTTDPTTEDPNIKPFMRNVNAETCERLGLPKDCTDAQAKLKDPNATVFALTQAGLQDYGSGIWAKMVHDWLRQGGALKISKQLPEAFLALSAADQAKVLALMPSLQ
jgi:hypothetical protein